MVDNLFVSIEVWCVFDFVWFLFGFGICYVGSVIVCDLVKVFGIVECIVEVV